MGIWKDIYWFLFSIISTLPNIIFLTRAVAIKCWTKFPFSNHAYSGPPPKRKKTQYILIYQFIWQIGYELTCVKLKVMTGLPKVFMTSLVFCFIKSCCTRLKISIKWALGFSAAHMGACQSPSRNIVWVFINPIQPRLTFEPSIQTMLLVLSGQLPGKSNV